MILRSGPIANELKRLLNCTHVSMTSSDQSVAGTPCRSCCPAGQTGCQNDTRFDHRRHRPMGPVGRVRSNFGDRGDQVYLVPSNFCNWLPFSHDSLFASITCLEHGDYLNTDISQGTAATCFRCGGIFECDFVTNFASESNSEKILKIA